MYGVRASWCTWPLHRMHCGSVPDLGDAWDPVPSQSVIEATAVLATSLGTPAVADVRLLCSFPSEDRTEKGVLVLRAFSSGCFLRNEDIVHKNKILLQQLSWRTEPPTRGHHGYTESS